jgi:hypothetical protein
MGNRAARVAGGCSPPRRVSAPHAGDPRAAPGAGTGNPGRNSAAASRGATRNDAGITSAIAGSAATAGARIPVVNVASASGSAGPGRRGQASGPYVEKQTGMALDFAVARWPRELAGRDAGAVRPDLAMRFAVSGVETIAAVEGTRYRRRAGPAVGDFLDLPAEFGLFAAKLVTPDPRPAGILI